MVVVDVTSDERDGASTKAVVLLAVMYARERRAAGKDCDILLSWWGMCLPCCCCGELCCVALLLFLCFLPRKTCFAMAKTLSNLQKLRRSRESFSSQHGTARCWQ